jgi:hypothetical protein
MQQLADGGSRIFNVMMRHVGIGGLVMVRDDANKRMGRMGAGTWCHS